MVNEIGFIGAGNMAEAIIGGIIQDGMCAPANIFIVEKNEDRAKYMHESYGVTVKKSIGELCGAVSMLVLAVKPAAIHIVLAELREVQFGGVTVSIVAGWTVAALERLSPFTTRVVRVMPNTPALVGRGMSVVSMRTKATQEELDSVSAIFKTLGRVQLQDDNAMDAVTAVSGSGPAYVYMFIEAMADAGVREGLTRAAAYELAAQTVLGAASMVLETGKHPGELKDNVTSPGGTTIEGVFELEDGGMRATIMNAVHAATERSRQLGK